MKKTPLLLSFSLFLGACSSPLPRRWEDLPPRAFAPPPYARFLRGLTICLDPGHGGHAGWKGYKRGPTGFREAVMNWKVACFLRDFLEKAGAKVVLTRHGDEAVSLADRSRIALEAGADLFLSLHHNAISGKPKVNYTTIWYHADPDYSPASLDVARCLFFGITHELRLSQVAEVPLHSDDLMYPGQGFGVLRHIQGKIPAVLCESSFFSNPAEEKRLKDPAYNKREAWGIFLGLARWAMGGLPSARLLREGPIPPGEPLRVRLLSGLEKRKSWATKRPLLLVSSIQPYLDGKRVERWSFDPKKNLLLLPPPRGGWKKGRHLLRVNFMNLFKNSPPRPALAWVCRLSS